MALDKSALRGITWKLGEKFRVPERVDIPPECSNLQPSEYLFQEINTSLEDRVLREVKLHEEGERKKQEESIRKEQEKNKKKDENNEMIKEEDLNKTKVKSKNLCEQNYSQNNIRNTPDILTPIIATSKDGNSDIKGDSSRQIDLTHFENEEDPFDKIELLSLNDMEELNKVYSTISSTQQTVNSSRIVSVKDLDFPQQNVSNQENESNLNNEDYTLDDRASKLPPISTIDVQNGRMNSMPVHNSKSNPDVHSQLSSSKSPPPRPSSGQDTTHPFIANSQKSCGDDKNLNSFVNENGNLQTWNPYNPLPPTTPTGNDMVNLDEECKILARTIIGMGFPRSSVVRTIEKFGKNEQKVVDYLCTVNALAEETGALSQDAENALDVNKANVDRAKTYLRHLSSLKQLGFSDQKIREALKNGNNDYNIALDILTAS
ncbi:DgyrCDS8866 [Dimorphilus gyrociliatus]|uniref:DgyrCDS8866 n=1 Tax=Dimorphilus gyrociliatus TaxID=2664684 RepID=A0A7I8VVD1_9ANNE|nr:DgyrCDS8866 [Dimorphilus gyrociliatus]